MKSHLAMLVPAAACAIALTAAAAPHGFQPCTHGPFRDITATSEEGEIIGEPDVGDWGCAGEQGGAAGRSARPGTVTGPAGSGGPSPPPSLVCMRPAYPNPAPDRTTITFQLPAASRVSLVVYGQRWRHGPHQVFPVRALVDAELAAGLHAVFWDLLDEGGARVTPGLYRAVMVVGSDAICGDIEVR